MFVDPVGMTSVPRSGGVTNVVPGDMVLYTASDKISPRFPYVPPLILDGIDA